MKEIYRLKAQKRAEGAQVMSTLVETLNTMSYEEDVVEGFAKQFLNAHPTLAAGVMRAFVSLCQQTAQNEDKMSDGRFVACAPLIKLVDDWSKENTIPFI
jgi:hypothetical protein